MYLIQLCYHQSSNKKTQIQYVHALGMRSAVGKLLKPTESRAFLLGISK